MGDRIRQPVELVSFLQCLMHKHKTKTVEIRPYKSQGSKQSIQLLCECVYVVPLCVFPLPDVKCAFLRGSK